MFGFSPTIYWLQLIFYILISFGFWTTWGLLGALLAAISKDFANLVKSFVSFLFWFSGILWNPDTVKVIWLRKLLRLNPITYLVTGFRDCLINKVWFWEKPSRLLYFLIAWGAMLIMALWAYRKVRKDIPDVL